MKWFSHPMSNLIIFSSFLSSPLLPSRPLWPIPFTCHGDSRDWLLLENEIGCGLKAKLQRGLTSQWTFSFSRERVVREMGLKFSYNYPSLKLHVECVNSPSNSIWHGKTFITEPLGRLSMTHESETCESKKVYWLSESKSELVHFDWLRFEEWIFLFFSALTTASIRNQVPIPTCRWVRIQRGGKSVTPMNDLCFTATMRIAKNLICNGSCENRTRKISM